VDRPPGLSVRLKLTLSYAGFLLLAGALMFAAAWLAGRYPGRSAAIRQRVPDVVVEIVGGFVPGNDAFLLRAFGPAASVVLLFLLVFGLLGGWLLAGRMLTPLDRITEATRLAARGSLSQRIQMPGRQDEFRLADSFDAMLAQLEAHVAEQRRFAANASHELRTPLAIAQTLLDVARNDPRREGDELVDRLHAVNARAIDLTEALLLLSRTDQRAFTPEVVDLSLIVEDAVETLLPIAEKHGVSMQFDGDIAPTLGSPALLLQMASNLIHNAIVHNLPRDGWVRIAISDRSETVSLSVENPGDRLTPEMVSTLTEPFRRGTDRVRTDHAGVGLGLAIVKNIAQAHDGALSIIPRPDGGIHVTATFPLASSAEPARRSSHPTSA
jgi:two-component system sensor histidine kinase VanS